MKDKALELVRKLLARRLELAGVRASNPDLLFQIEASEAEPYPGGGQVRVRTWRQWSEAHVKLDGETGELLGYSIDRWADPVTQAEMTQEQALALAGQKVKIPAEARLTSFRQFDYAPQRKMAELRWEHYYQDLRVDGDYIRIVLHPTTGNVVKLEWFWRTVQLP